jgi:hypothetical protein
MAFGRIRRAARVLDLGCSLGSALRKEKRCHVTINPVPDGGLDEFRLWDVNRSVSAIEANGYETVVVLVRDRAPELAGEFPGGVAAEAVGELVD